jgi:hypothetical protein
MSKPLIFYMAQAKSFLVAEVEHRFKPEQASTVAAPDGFRYLAKLFIPPALAILGRRLRDLFAAACKNGLLATVGAVHLAIMVR